MLIRKFSVLPFNRLTRLVFRTPYSPRTWFVNLPIFRQFLLLKKFLGCDVSDFYYQMLVWVNCSLWQKHVSSISRTSSALMTTNQFLFPFWIMFWLCNGHDLQMKGMKAMATKIIWEMASHWHDRRLKEEFNVLSLVIKG